VHEALSLRANVSCAVKIMSKRKVCKDRLGKELVKKELGVLQLLDHPHIVHVLELLSDRSNFYCVLELMPHGNLMEVYDRIVKNGWSFTERDAANIVK